MAAISADAYDALALLSSNQHEPTQVSVVAPADLKPLALCTLQQRQLLDELGNAITVLGEASAKAQQLKTSVTNYKRFCESDHRLYVLTCALPVPPAEHCTKGHTKHMMIGLLKVGRKRLFLNNRRGELKDCTLLCVLDFYVSELLQRMGHGLTLFQHMLEKENVQPQDLAIDRPSPKMINFLRKNFALKDMHPQPNNFVLFSSPQLGDSAINLCSSAPSYQHNNSTLRRDSLSKTLLDASRPLKQSAAAAVSLPFIDSVSKLTDAWNSQNRPVPLKNTHAPPVEKSPIDTSATRHNDWVKSSLANSRQVASARPHSHSYTHLSTGILPHLSVGITTRNQRSLNECLHRY